MKNALLILTIAATAFAHPREQSLEDRRHLTQLHCVELLAAQNDERTKFAELSPRYLTPLDQRLMRRWEENKERARWLHQLQDTDLFPNSYAKKEDFNFPNLTEAENKAVAESLSRWNFLLVIHPLFPDDHAFFVVGRDDSITLATSKFVSYEVLQREIEHVRQWAEEKHRLELAGTPDAGWIAHLNLNSIDGVRGLESRKFVAENLNTGALLKRTSPGGRVRRQGVEGEYDFYPGRAYAPGMILATAIAPEIYALKKLNTIRNELFSWRSRLTDNPLRRWKLKKKLAEEEARLVQEILRRLIPLRTQLVEHYQAEMEIARKAEADITFRFYETAYQYSIRPLELIAIEPHEATLGDSFLPLQEKVRQALSDLTLPKPTLP